MLQKNIDSLAAQTCQDFEHILIRDDEGRGVAWANGQLQHADLNGQYVLVLDDDDKLADPTAVEKLKEATADNPGLVIFKADHAGLGILPSPKAWKNQPVGGHIGSCDFITRSDLWREHIEAFDMPEAGDFYFLRSMWLDEPDVVWLDEQLAAVQRISRGRAE
jgi:glycosyltransferase involved in cell wall biosynthesis